MSQDNIFREVDEELRSERMRKLWRGYGPYLIAAAVAVVLVVAAKEIWDWYQSGNAATSSDQYYQALTLTEGTDTAAAQAALNNVISAGHGGYPTLARFKQAELLARDGKSAEAVSAYDALSTNQNNGTIRELALVLAANILVDSGTVAEVQARVGGLDNPESPMRNAAREAMGLAYYKAGDLENARKSFEAVTNDPLAPPDVQGRVRIYLGQLTAEGAAPAEAADVPPDAAAAVPAEPAASGEAAAPVVTDEGAVGPVLAPTNTTAPTTETPPAP